MSTLALEITRHAEIRMRQRGIRESDLELLLRCGREVRPDVFRLTRKAAQSEIERLKRQIKRIERLKDVTAVICDGRIVTAYRLMKNGQNRRR